MENIVYASKLKSMSDKDNEAIKEWEKGKHSKGISVPYRDKQRDSRATGKQIYYNAAYKCVLKYTSCLCIQVVCCTMRLYTPASQW